MKTGKLSLGEGIAPWGMLFHIAKNRGKRADPGIQLGASGGIFI
jgi:hypothetical protein